MSYISRCVFYFNFYLFMKSQDHLQINAFYQETLRALFHSYQILFHKLLLKKYDNSDVLNPIRLRKSLLLKG